MDNCPACAERKMKANARAATRAAVKSGRLVRQRCADCVAKGVHNNWPVQAHHEDYSKPLEIIWLCNNHHHLRHSKWYLPKGPAQSGHPKMLPPAPGINASRSEWIDINAIDGTDPVHFRQRPRLTADEFDDNQFSNENGDGEIY